MHALLDLARNFDLHVVAESVEDHETWTALASLGCHVVQGYYLSKPLPANKVESWLKTSRADRFAEERERSAQFMLPLAL